MLSAISPRGTTHRELSTVVQIGQDYRFKDVSRNSSALVSLALARHGHVVLFNGGGREAAIFRPPWITYSEKCVHSKAVPKRYCRLLGFEVNCVSLRISVFFFSFVNLILFKIFESFFSSSFHRSYFDSFFYFYNFVEKFNIK